jgi:hypothetical protein
MGVVCASVPNWFSDDNLRTKSWIEARYVSVSYEFLAQVR